ncbi:SusC/RagA family TonB-linked outer membrane protein [Tunicatimonas pelagia]|uniref:SusC/RagA family TonB-linked outer membrane protein n=1 Tax=Tunicatimonas pelagia TaxID=931531 RepID=UPI0026651F1B|nr:TonB-dependent receptor [Tunicatimonas pelagia]WKN45451.1 TonB-dependent receptor [Tunicatimonas pelagia]
MRNIIQTCIWVGMVCLISPPLFSQPLASAQAISLRQENPTRSPNQNIRELTDVLSDLQRQYNVLFNYEPNVVEGMQVKDMPLAVATDSTSSMEYLLSNYLTPLKLDYKKIRENYYIIVPRQNTGVPKVDKKPLETSDASLASLQRTYKPTQQLDPVATAEKIITGVVTDLVSNEPLPGVNILVKGTTNGTVTDADGNYRLVVSDNAVSLIFSFIGYTSEEVIINGRSTIDMSLAPDIQALSEVVVVGYGEQSRQNITGAVAEVEVESIKNSPNTNVTQALRGRVAGVQFQDNGRPGQGGALVVRGRSSITASNAPLVVVDGVFFNGSLADINPNDVESMEVLKDASASAIYGARAANGVILVTTKKGISPKPSISLNAYYGVSTWTKKLNLLTPERYIEKTLDWRRATDQPADPNDIESYLENNEIENFRNGTTIDPWDEVSQDASIQSYDLSVSGKLENTNYYFSVAYTDEEGLIYGDNAQRIALRSNLQVSLNSWLNVGMTAQFTHRDLSGVEADLGNAYYLSPYGKMYFNGDRSDPVPFPSNETLNVNPMFAAIFDDNEEKYNNLFANFFATIDFPFLEGLSYRLNASPNLRWSHEYNFTPSYQSEEFLRQSSASKVNRQNFDWVVENILKYEFNVDEIHDFDVTFLYGRNQFNADSTLANGNFLLSNATGWDNLSLAEVQTIASERTQLDQISIMGRLNYRLMNKYLFTLTARRDGSSVFGADNKWGTFPSAAVAWIASEENFLQNIAQVNYLKVRASYGRIGNQGLNPYSSLNRMGLVQYVFGNKSPTYVGLQPTQMGNPELGWETSTSANVAVEFGVLNNRISGTVELYRTDTEDLLLNRAIPELNGFNSVLQNVGETRNQGIEISLSTTNVQSEDFQWSSDVVFTSNRNEIVSLYGFDADEDGVEDDDISNNWFIGEPVLVEFGYVFDGIWQEGDEIPFPFIPGDVRVKDVNSDGEFDTDDRTIVDQREPQFTWGLNNRFTYRNFEFSFFVNGQHGFSRWFQPLDPSNAGDNFPDRALNMLDEGDGWWTPENRSNTRPALNFRNSLQQRLYAARDFVRIQDVSLSYTFEQSFLDRLNLSNLKVYLSGRNLATFTDWPGWDPEIGSPTDEGFPAARTFVAGFNLSF